MGHLLSLPNSPHSTSSPTPTTSPDWAALCTLPPPLRERLVVQLNRFVRFANQQPEAAAQMLDESEEMLSAWDVAV